MRDKEDLEDYEKKTTDEFARRASSWSMAFATEQQTSLSLACALEQEEIPGREWWQINGARPILPFSPQPPPATGPAGDLPCPGRPGGATRPEATTATSETIVEVPSPALAAPTTEAGGSPDVSAVRVGLEALIRRKFHGSPDRDAVLGLLPGWLDDLTDPRDHAIPPVAAAVLIREAIDLRRKAKTSVVGFLDSTVRNKAKEFKPQSPKPIGPGVKLADRPGSGRAVEDAETTAQMLARRRTPACDEPMADEREAQWSALLATDRADIKAAIKQKPGNALQPDLLLKPQYLDEMDRRRDGGRA
jgi:hypothetical protein